MQNLYIDVDGVLNRMDAVTKEGVIPWRRDAKIFLEWCLEHFKCHWLTAWDQSSIETRLLPEIGLEDRSADFHYAAWDFGKTSGIDTSEKFYWIDDIPMPGDIQRLKNTGLEESFVLVDPKGEEELQTLSTQLALRERRNYGNPIPDLSGQVPADPA